MLATIVKHRYWWLMFSLLVIVPGAIALALFGLHLGIDFSGGALWELRYPTATTTIDTEKVRTIFAQNGFDSSEVRESDVTSVDGKVIRTTLVRTKPLSTENPAVQQAQVLAALTKEFGAVERAALQNVGATVSGESTRYAVLAVFGASLAILGYLTLAFRKAPHPLRYGICAILAMLHDVLVVVGVAAILGKLINLEVDALFLTALLTVISFSVHDTIVVFDRVRENLLARRSGESFEDIVNHSVVQTLPRSINTQLTTFFTLVALLLFGPSTIHNFLLVLLIGLVSGTYSSIFNAAQLLVIWENHEWRNWFGRKPQLPDSLSAN